jgi:hypothetical protein
MAENKLVATPDTALPATRQKLRSYVDQHPHCADLALPLYVAFLSSTIAGATAPNSGSVLTQFPPSRPLPPIFVDLPGLTILSGVELSQYSDSHSAAQTSTTTAASVPTVGSSASHASANQGSHGSGVAALRKPRSEAQASACVTDLVALLQLTKAQLPEATFKSTMANTHWVW